MIALLCGCSTGPNPTFDGPVYPPDLTKLETLDVQVQIGDHDLTLTSASAQPVGPGTLWINRWFAADIDAIAPGERVVIPLSRFEDQNGLAPRAGGFFATRDRTDIVMAELVTPQGAHGLRLLGERD